MKTFIIFAFGKVIDSFSGMRQNTLLVKTRTREEAAKVYANTTLIKVKEDAAVSLFKVAGLEGGILVFDPLDYLASLQ